MWAASDAGSPVCWKENKFVEPGRKWRRSIIPLMHATSENRSLTKKTYFEVIIHSNVLLSRFLHHHVTRLEQTAPFMCPMDHRYSLSTLLQLFKEKNEAPEQEGYVPEMVTYGQYLSHACAGKRLLVRGTHTAIAGTPYRG